MFISNQSFMDTVCNLYDPCSICKEFELHLKDENQPVKHIYLIAWVFVGKSVVSFELEKVTSFKTFNFHYVTELSHKNIQTLHFRKIASIFARIIIILN